MTVRDVDVDYFQDEISQEQADVSAKYFSPDDFSHRKHGAQEISNIEEYMNTRDFTMNQVIYKDGKLIASRAVMYDIYIDDFYCSEYNGFQLAVAIQKSFDWGDDFPKKFLWNLIESPIFENDLSFLLDDNGNIRDVYDIMTELNEDILRYPFIFRNTALRFYMSETDDREYETKMERYEEFEDKFMKNRDKFRGNIKLQKN